MRKLLKDNASEVLKIFLKELKIKHTDVTINTLKQNPYFPDLISVSQTLSKLSIENVAIKVDYNQLIEISTPCIVHLHDNGGMYLVVKSVNENSITFIAEDNKEEAQTKEEFIKSWSGYTLIINTENYNNSEKGYSVNYFKQSIQKLRIPIIIIAVVFFLFHFFNYNIENYYALFFKALSLVGFVTSTLLLVQLVDKNNIFIKKVCNAKKNDKINCSSILNSKSAKFLGLISWSEVGFIYFFSQILTFLIFDNPSSYLNILSILVSPYVFYSIYYQWKIAKTWCKLCLIVQLVLIVQAVIGTTLLLDLQSSISQYWSSNFILNAISIPLLILIITSYLLPLITESNEKKNKIKLTDSIRMQPNIFHSQLNKSTSINTKLIPQNLLTYGNKKPTNHLLLVINPTCEPCIRTHTKLSTIISYNENIQISEIFLVEKEDSESYNLAIKMIEIYLAEPENYFKNAISDYYYNYIHKGDKWIHKYWKSKYATERSSKILESHFKWLLNNGITNTPQIICNGKFLPIEYHIDDLEYLLY
jgi:uncharacterized membrane protein|tara:strand:+ start:3742 stop:5340 length:1599 start_codon:yes stop_codon:yes gene_type:complete